MKRWHLTFVFLASIVGSLSACWYFSNLPPRKTQWSIEEKTLEIDGTMRSYRLVTPIPSTQSSSPVKCPVFIVFHGIGDSAESMAAYSRLDSLAATHDVIVVYPATFKNMWSTQLAEGESWEDSRDVRFFDAMLTELSTNEFSNNYSIDPKRVYLLGMSNGATFVQTLASVRNEKIAAVVAHSGGRSSAVPALDSPVLETSAEVKVPPTLLIVGDQDRVAKTIESDAEHYAENGVEVELIVVPKLGHAWSPSHNEAIANFLLRHQR